MKIHKIEKSRSIMLLHELTPGGLEQDCDEWLAHKHFNLLRITKHAKTHRYQKLFVFYHNYYYLLLL